MDHEARAALVHGQKLGRQVTEVSYDSVRRVWGAGHDFVRHVPGFPVMTVRATRPEPNLRGSQINRNVLPVPRSVR